MNSSVSVRASLAAAQFSPPKLIEISQAAGQRSGRGADMAADSELLQWYKHRVGECLIFSRVLLRRFLRLQALLPSNGAAAQPPALPVPPAARSRL